ncbi:hypothetical protein [Pleionea sediminis]|uniref:hypothetical protein n=1 Tax=Pleionea sediminis TaxID=2569479 RepID=UPI00118501E2|nr:hypothetical protein [Pleionea sediminis]
MKKLLIATALTAASVSGFTAEPSFNFVEAGIVKYDDGDSKKVLGNFEFNTNFYGVASYEIEDDAGDDLTAISIGAGYKTTIGASTSLYGQLEYTDYSVDTDFGDFSEDGYNLSAGIRSMVTNSTELFGEVTNGNIDSYTVTTIGIGARQSFTDNFGAYVRYDMTDRDDDFYGVGVSLKF